MKRWMIAGLFVLMAVSVAHGRGGRGGSSGVQFASGTITSSSNSGWIRASCAPNWANYRLVPANLATDETLDVDIDFGYDSVGAGASSGGLISFAQVSSTNVAEKIEAPNPLPQYYQVSWVVAGSTPSMDFVIYFVTVGC